MCLFMVFYRLFCLGVVCFVFMGIGLCLHRFFKSKPNRHRHYITRCTRLWAKCICYFLNIRIQVEDTFDSSPNALIVCNHVGSPDIFVVGSCFNTFFISKNDVANWPLMGVLAKLGHTLFVNRSRRHQVKQTIQEMTDRLNGGFSVVVFPEGQVTDGSDVIPFKTSHFEAAVLAGRPVIPVMIRYLDSNTPSVASWMNVNFVSHFFQLLKNPLLEVRVRVFPPILPDGNRRDLAQKSYISIRKGFNETVS